MKHWFVLLLYLLPSLLKGQPFQVEGVVLDVLSKQPLVNAHIFIDQSFKAIRSDSAGKFSLKEIADKTFEVVVVAKGYKAITYKTTPDRQKITIRFELLPNNDSSFKEEDWLRWGTLFKNNLVGNTENAKQCELLNPEVLRFTYNDSLGELNVSATDILQIINDRLGYLVNYQLETFQINSNSQKLEVFGYSYFKNLTTKRAEVTAKWRQNRKEAFEGSLMHFMRSLYINNVEQEGFELHTLQRAVEGEPLFKGHKKLKNYSIFTSGKMLDQGKIVNYVFLLDNQVLSPQTVRQFDDVKKSCFFVSKDLLQVVYKREKEGMNYLIYKPNVKGLPGFQSSYLQTATKIKVEPNGSFTEKQDLTVGGYMSWEKLAEMLPLEYHPGQ